MMKRYWSKQTVSEDMLKLGKLDVKKEIWEVMAERGGLPIELIDSPLVERVTEWDEGLGVWTCYMFWAMPETPNGELFVKTDTKK